MQYIKPKQAQSGDRLFSCKTLVVSNINWCIYVGPFVRNPSVILSPTLARNEKVEHYIKIKTHKLIALRFWVESGVSVLCG